MGHGAFGGEQRGGLVEHRAVAAELDRHDDHGGDDEDVDHDVLDEGDHGRSAQPRRVGVDGEDREGDRQRQVARGEAKRLDRLLHADELQRDVGHGGDDAGQRDGEAEPAVAVAPGDEVGGGDVAALVRHRPELGKGQVEQRVDQDRVGHGKEAEGTAGVNQRRHSDHGVGGVEVAADQEPRHPRTKAAPAKPPFVQVRQVAAAPPPGEEADGRHEREDDDEDDRRRPVRRDRGRVHALPFARSIRNAT